MNKPDGCLGLECSLEVVKTVAEPILWEPCPFPWPTEAEEPWDTILTPDAGFDRIDEDAACGDVLEWIFEEIADEWFKGVLEFEDKEVEDAVVNGTDNLALTASKWSLLAIKLLTVSSNRTFSWRNWCKHDSRDATAIK